MFEFVRGDEDSKVRFVREDDVPLLLLLLLPLVINAGNRPLIFPETGERLFSDAVAVG